MLVLDAGQTNGAFVDPLVSAGERMEDDPICFRGKDSNHVEADYLSYKGFEDLLYDFGPLARGKSNPLRLRRGI